MERWKDIPGYEGLYQASTCGRIRSAPGKVTSSKRFQRRVWKSRVLKGRGDNPQTGKRVSLWKDGLCKGWLVARLVALTWLGADGEGLTVNHINGNRMDNSIENLEWLSLGDNIRHGFRTGLYENVQRPVELLCKKSGSVLIFNSMAEASRFLGMNEKFVSCRLSRGNPQHGDFTIIRA